MELKGFKRFFANFISMSNSEYVEVEHAEAFDLRTVDSMEVEGEDDTRSSNAVVSDRGWIKSGPHDGPQATVDNELEEPSNCSLIQACALLTTRVATLEEEIRELKRCAALQPSHSATASQQPHDDAMAHRVGTLEGELRDLKTSAASQHSHSAAALQQPQDDAMAHRVGTLEEDLRDLKTSAASQPSHSAAALQQPQDDAMAHRVGTLEQEVIDLKQSAASQPSRSASASQQLLNDAMAHRVGALEADMRDLKNSAATQSSYSASASQQPQDDAMAASCASSSLPHKRKTCQQYRVPAFRPMRVNSGKCQWCQRCWSTAEFKVNFQLDKNAWEQAMSKLFYGFESTEEGLAGGLCDFIESSVGTPYNVQTSLEQLKTLLPEQGEEFANLMADKLWQPDQGDDKCWFLFRGGDKLKRYITFGCVRCQRGVTLWYGSPTFWTDFMRYFP